MKPLRRILPLAALLACTSAWSSPGDTAWTSTYDPGGEPSSMNAMTVSGTTAYAAISGPYNGEPSSHADIHLRAYDIPTGALLWEDVWTSTGQLDNSVSDIAASGGRVFIVAVRGVPGTFNFRSYEWAVRAYVGNSGTVLWEDHCPGGGADRVVATSRWVYVAGACTTGATQTVRIRAYAAATGKLRWERRIPDMYSLSAIALAGDELVVTGIEDLTAQSLLVRAYDVIRGRLRWQRRPELPQGAVVSGSYLAADGRVAYLGWWSDHGDGTSTGTVAAYESTRGRLRWQSHLDGPVTGLALAPGWLYVAKAGGESMVSAYGANSGLLRWQDSPGTPAAPCRASAVTVGGNQLFVAGSAYHPLHETASNFLVRAYTLGGTLLWADDVPTQAKYPANVWEIGWSDGFAVMGGTSGFFQPPFGSTFWQEQGYVSPALRRTSFRSP